VLYGNSSLLHRLPRLRPTSPRARPHQSFIGCRAPRQQKGATIPKVAPEIGERSGREDHDRETRTKAAAISSIRAGGCSWTHSPTDCEG
jgi:hypothetical protein